MTTQGYQKQIHVRVGQFLQRIAGKPAPVVQGRVVPAAGDLAIGTGRRMSATVLFLDLCAFSTRPCETIDEQTGILQQLTLLFSEFIKIIEDHGGVVEKNTGDGLMAYFVKDVGRLESHQTRAVEAALSMFYAAESAINPIFHAYQMTPFDFRIAINSGEITIADVGAAQRFRGMVAVGTAANVASKMLAVATSGQILLGENVVIGLRADWLQWVQHHSDSEKFAYRENNTAYPYYVYFGRYMEPE